MASTLIEYYANEIARNEVENVRNDHIKLIAKHQRNTYTIITSPDTKVIQIKAILQELTNVLISRQKLVGISIGSRPAPDDAEIQKISKLKNPHHFFLVGTPEEDIFEIPQEADDMPEVLDDFDINLSSDSERYLHSVDTLANLDKYSRKTVIQFINQPRDGKRLLVLDLDHTLLDFSGNALGPTINADIMRMKRPHLDAFLTAVYAEYDIAIWSQTSWRWLELKLTALGLLHHSAYKICFVLDKSSMFHVRSTDRWGKERRHQVKALEIIWRNLPQWHKENTIHIDDLGRNFILNPSNGIKVKAFYSAEDESAADDELIVLKDYLLHIAISGIVSRDSHRDWRRKRRRSKG